MTIEEFVYDWNTIEPSFTAPGRHISIDDETCATVCSRLPSPNPRSNKNSNCFT